MAPLFRVNDRICFWWDGELKWVGRDAPAIEYLQSDQVHITTATVNESTGRLILGETAGRSITSEDDLALALSLWWRDEVPALRSMSREEGFKPPPDYEPIERDGEGNIVKPDVETLRAQLDVWRALWEYAISGKKSHLSAQGLMRAAS